MKTANGSNLIIAYKQKYKAVHAFKSVHLLQNKNFYSETINVCQKHKIYQRTFEMVKKAPQVFAMLCRSYFWGSQWNNCFNNSSFFFSLERRINKESIKVLSMKLRQFGKTLYWNIWISHSPHLQYNFYSAF